MNDLQRAQWHEAISNAFRVWLCLRLPSGRPISSNELAPWWPIQTQRVMLEAGLTQRLDGQWEAGSSTLAWIGTTSLLQPVKSAPSNVPEFEPTHWGKA